jgi:hypothetical protein
MAGYMLFLHEDPRTFSNLSPSEIEGAIRQYVEWRERLAREGRITGGHKLADEGGRWLTRETGGAVRVVDGPFSEAREVVGGYFLIEAADYDEAVEIARDCPHLAFGGRIELRALDPAGG